MGVVFGAARVVVAVDVVAWFVTAAVVVAAADGDVVVCTTG